MIKVSSEIGRLRRVIVHRPDEGISRISPRRSEDLLFDDIVYLPQMQLEHNVFTRVLKLFLGSENVLEIEDLLLQALHHGGQDGKQEMIDLIVDYEELPRSAKELLLSLPDEELSAVLISGYYHKDDYILFDPIPNFLFTRDLMVGVNEHLIITKAAKEARFRENFITRFIVWANPIFKKLREEKRLVNLNNVDLFPPSKRGEPVSVEGGDVMILNSDYLLVGISERTTEHGARSLRKALFDRGIIRNFVQIDLPHDRSFMHIDTTFTQINRQHMVAYKPIVLEGLGSYVEVYRQDGSMQEYPALKDFIHAEINPSMEFILSGNGESPYQEREQWTDGCNLVALRPGVAITYDRNPRTEEAFRHAGYNLLHANELLRQADAGQLDPESVENTIILLPSNELSRARGGSHCMTCPIERDEI